MAKKIFVGKISSKTSDQKLFDHFSQAGKVISAVMTKNINQENSDHGYVVMSNEKETEDAISKLNNTVLDGNHIKVIEAHPMDQERRSYYKRRF